MVKITLTHDTEHWEVADVKKISMTVPFVEITSLEIDLKCYEFH